MTYEVPSLWFVVWEGDLNDDRLDKGVESFYTGDAASKFKRRYENRGLKCKVYFGELSGCFHCEGKHAKSCKCDRCSGRDELINAMVGHK